MSTSGGKVSDSGIFAEARVQIVNIEEANDALEVEDESLVCPTSLEVDKALEVHQQLTLFCEIGKEMREVVKVNTYAQREIMKKKISTIASINFNFSFVFCDVKKDIRIVRKSILLLFVSLFVLLFCARTFVDILGKIRQI